jgi:hypothetical protein
MSHVADSAPTGLVTPETYLGAERIDVERYAGFRIVPGMARRYRFPMRFPQNSFSFGGSWNVGPESALALRGARLALHFHAKDVYIVLGGRGTVRALVDGEPARTIRVDAYRLYTVRASPRAADATLELEFSPGVRGYSFTFG